MKKFFLPLFFLISFISCSLNINQTATGLSITLPSNTSKAAVATLYNIDRVNCYEIIVSDALGKTFTKRGNPGESVPFDKVSVGECRVDVWALDESDCSAAFGSKVVKVEENKVSEVTIEASFMAQNIFFLNTPRGAWSSNWQEYYRTNKFYSARNDFDFGVEIEDQEHRGQDGLEIIKVVKNYYAKVLNPSFNYSAMVLTNKLDFDSFNKPRVVIKMKADYESDIVVALQDYMRESTPVINTVHVTPEMQSFTFNYAERQEAYATLPKQCVLSIYITKDCGKIYVENVSFDNGDALVSPTWSNITTIPSDRNVVSCQSDDNSATFTFDQVKARTLGILKPAAGISGSPRKFDETGMHLCLVELGNAEAGSIEGDVILKCPGTDSGKYSVYANNISVESEPFPYYFILPKVKGYEDQNEEYISSLFATSMNGKVTFTTVSSAIDSYDYNCGTVGFESGSSQIAAMTGTLGAEQSSTVLLLPGEAKDFEVILCYFDYIGNLYSESFPATRFLVTDPLSSLSGMRLESVNVNGVKKFRIKNTSSTTKLAKVKMAESGLPLVENGSFDLNAFTGEFNEKIVRVLQSGGTKVLFNSRFYEGDELILDYNPDVANPFFLFNLKCHAESELFSKVFVKLYNYKTNQYVTDGPVEYNLTWETDASTGRKYFSVEDYSFPVQSQVDFHDLVLSVEIPESVNELTPVEIRKCEIKQMH